MEKIKIALVGGGAGLSQVARSLNGLYDRLDVTAIVTVMDSGGSARTERDEFGVLPVSDARKALIASCPDPELLIRRLVGYRFDKGNGIRGGTLGNLVLVALTDLLGSEAAAINALGQLIGSQARVLPISDKTSTLVLQYADGTMVTGEHMLDDLPFLVDHLGEKPAGVKLAMLEPKVGMNLQAAEAILAADWVIFPPGDLYGSIIVNCLVSWFADVLKQSKPKIMYIANLMTRFGQTHGLTLMGHVNTLEKYIQLPIDVVVVNDQPIPAEFVQQYMKEHAEQVVFNLAMDPRVVKAPLLLDIAIGPEKGDTLGRSILRHDPEKLRPVLKQILLGTEV